MVLSLNSVVSLLLFNILSIVGFQLLIVAVVADLISANRRLIEDTLLRIKKIELDEKKMRYNELDESLVLLRVCANRAGDGMIVVPRSYWSQSQPVISRGLYGTSPFLTFT